MKNYRRWFPLIMILFMVLSWYKIVDAKKVVNNEYDQLIESARENKNKKITKQALSDYKKALNIKDTPEVWNEVIEYLWEQGESGRYY